MRAPDLGWLMITQSLPKAHAFPQLINFMSGILLLGIEVHDINLNWELITMFLGRQMQ